MTETSSAWSIREGTAVSMPLHEKMLLSSCAFVSPLPLVSTRCSRDRRCKNNVSRRLVMVAAPRTAKTDKSHELERRRIGDAGLEMTEVCLGT